MGQVKIITDSTADIPKDLAEALDISVVPIKVHLAGQSYLDGVDLFPSQFYQKMREITELPTTSQPSPLEIAEFYRKAIQSGAKQIFSLHISSKMSGTYQSCMLAKAIVQEEYPDAEIMVYDSKSVAYALGVIVVLVARAAKEGKTLDELVQLADRVREKQGLVALVDTLEYLQKGGRIGKAAALVGSLLSIKPIISISEDGEVTAIDKARGKNKAFSKVFELLQQKVPVGPVYAAILHADQEEDAKTWLNKVKMMYDVREEIVVDIGPAVGTHAGPGTVGCLLVPLEQL
ncbi:MULTISPECIES: DegV family protein [Thermoactinomyces]|uniref:DegV family protein n=1 Tax=Thermoactinomyces daqus TaxID=1329516 RepID=A0A7W2AJ84_9BACL|nr:MULTISPECIES: DegV family protein [Thermoactinomyces]MBA4544050.1 DegV family protein [Thermoactinomyces daqus]MBH8598132.1 DegV family protein [Thermoactinomyces sp. CICC 10523]MBH8607030.1 DegV family protein [Thermoactinomyces sp. CICC 10521]